jgi:CheY-like chemotaxis protein
MTRTILVADDEMFIATAYGDALEGIGFRVLIAYDGMQALESITNSPYAATPPLSRSNSAMLACSALT